MPGRPRFRRRSLSSRDGDRAARTSGGAELSQVLPADCCRPSPTGETERSVDVARIALYFDRRAAQSETGPLELPAPLPISALLLDLLADVAEIRPSVLDLGCGTGAGSIRLLQRGAASVTGIDLSPASIEIARRRAEAAGLEPEQAAFAVGDVATTLLQPHDWVLLDRVICCDGDPDRVVGNALTAASRRIVFSVPQSRGLRGLLNAMRWGIQNPWRAIVSPDRCRNHVHGVNSIEQRLEAAGFRKLRAGHRGLWYASVFERESSDMQADSLVV